MISTSRSFRQLRRGLALGLGLFLLAGGCRRAAPPADGFEWRDPLLRKARTQAEQGDCEGALACLNQLLAKRPDLPQAHLNAALLYDDFQQDYIRAVYHYQRYLELRPAAEESAMIAERIGKARLALAAALAAKLPGFSGELAELHAENQRLKQALRNVRANLARQLALAAASQAAPATAAPAAPAVETYVVQEYDTLTRIASKLYQDPGQWGRLYEANRGVLAAPERLRPGQTLQVPR